jgi:hypothetical protein
MGRRRNRTTAVFAVCLGATALWGGLAGANHKRPPVDAVTIKVDRAAKTLSGKVVANSTTTHFCTTANDWPVNVFMARPGSDKKVVHMKTNFDGKWRFRVRSDRLKGKRVYAEVPSFPNSGHGFCVGKRSRSVTSP